MLSIRPYTASTAAARPMSNRFSAWPLSCVIEARKDFGGFQHQTKRPETGLGLRPE